MKRMRKFDVTVFVPCYKRSGLLVLCLERLRECIIQNHGCSFQVFLFDDGNDQEYVRLLELWWGDFNELENVECGLLHVNGVHGVNNIIQAACELADGEFIQKLDADCLLPHGWFEWSVSFMRKEPNSRLVLSPNVSETNAAVKYASEDKGLYTISRVTIDGLWFTRTSLVKGLSCSSKSTRSVNALDNVLARHLGANTIYIWHKSLVAEDIGYWKGTNKLHPRDDECREYAKEVGRPVEW